MTEYYFDIETYSTGVRPNPDNDKIISIQFQKINLKTGKPLEELVILKEWDSSEEQIVKEFFNRFFLDESKVWNFIPVGYNLNFEWEFLIAKFEKYLGKKLASRDLHYRIPHLDLKHVIILLNGGKFTGSKLSNFTKKPQDGNVVKAYYDNRQFYKLEEYIKTEAESFLEFLQKIMVNIEKVVGDTYD